MKKTSDVKVMLKEAGILFLITLLSGLILGYVYNLTKEPIRLQKEKAIQEACAQVFPQSEELGLTFEAQEYVPDGTMAEELEAMGVEIGTVYQAVTADGTLFGYVVESTSKGFKGNIMHCIGVTAEGMVSGVSIVEMSETQGLGTRAYNELLPQFAQVTTDAFTYTKTGSSADSEVDAISGATITTRAVVEAVNGGVKVALDVMGGGSNE